MPDLFDADVRKLAHDWSSIAMNCETLARQRRSSPR
jgi:hypothetical protein